LLFTGGFCQAENLIAVFEYDIQLAGLQKQHVRLLNVINPAPRPPPPSHPNEQCPAPVLGLTVQPCGESCGFVIGFDFLTVKFISNRTEIKLHPTLESMPMVSTMFRKMLNRPKEMNASCTKVPLAHP
jgi:hypothetical protein